MPWTCACGADVEADETACPACAAPKTSWTLVREKTRTFVLAGKRFELLRGEDRAVATTGPVLDKAEARRLTADGALPAPARTLYVRLHARDARDPTVTVAPEFEAQEVVGQTLRPFEPAGAAGWVDVPLVLVHGPGGLEGIAFEKAHVIDVTEDTERGLAPALEVRALGRPARSVPLEPGGDAFLSARFTDRSGRLVVADRALTVEGLPVRTDADGRVVVPGLPLTDLAVAFEDGATLVPAVHDPEIVVEVRLRFVTGGAVAASAGAREAKDVGRPASLYGEANRAEDPAGEDDDHADAGHDHDHGGASWYLAAVLLDRTGRYPLVRRDVVVDGRAGETDDHGLVIVEGVDPGDLLVELEDTHEALVPAVHHPALVVHARVRTAEATDEDRAAALPPPSADEGGPGARYEPVPTEVDDEPEPVAAHVDVPAPHDHSHEHGQGADA